SPFRKDRRSTEIGCAEPGPGRIGASIAPGPPIWGELDALESVERVDPAEKFARSDRDILIAPNRQDRNDDLKTFLAQRLRRFPHRVRIARQKEKLLTRLRLIFRQLQVRRQFRIDQSDAANQVALA